MSGAAPPVQLVILCSPSGAGKTTLARRLLQDPDLPGIHFSVSHTTRPARDGEVDGRDYHFVDEALFRSTLEADGFAEHATVHGNLYGTSVEEIDRIRAIPGARAVIFDIDVQGADQLVERYPRALRIFILPPSLAVLEARLRDRGTETDEDLALRLGNAVGEVERYDTFDHIIVNDDLDEAHDRLKSAIRGHGPGREAGVAVAEALLAQWKEARA
ncbi:MAG: guanylate kinase [Deltaproteobacteria bacterium]|nr:guanylate kinase [Deltaproteobacteria bacterium]